LFQLGIDRLINDSNTLESLNGLRWGFIGHPASVTSDIRHSLDVLIEKKQLQVTTAFGPQHGMKGEKQYNMIETPDERNSKWGIPIWSLYGETRTPTKEMIQNIDGFLVDLQDVGCRIYTYITTLLECMKVASDNGKRVVVCDRPNPAGRPVEGRFLDRNFESFVGCAPIPIRHGLTIGELALYFKKQFQLSCDLTVIPMTEYDPNTGPGFGWPQALTWVNPSPNAASLNMARCFAGTVMIEGTTLSEGRGTTVPLEVIGAPNIDGEIIVKKMLENANWTSGCRVRTTYFQPSFYKHVDSICSGLQIHATGSNYKHLDFRPFRLVALFLKTLREVYPDYELWRNFQYEYVSDKLAIDVITAGTWLREWVDNRSSSPSDLEPLLVKDETEWLSQRKEFLLYPDQD